MLRNWNQDSIPAKGWEKLNLMQLVLKSWTVLRYELCMNLNGSLTMTNLQVPTGLGVKNTSLKTDLLYNEYIVYDVAQVCTSRILIFFISKFVFQVQAKYMFRLKFNYKI